MLLLHRFPVLLCNPAGSRVIFMAVLTNQTHATGADTPKETPEVTALKQQNAVLNLQVEAAQARQKLLTATFPSDVKALDGTIKVDGDHPIESQMYAWKAVNDVATQIARDVKASATKVLIYNDSDVNLLVGLGSFKAQLNLLKTQLDQEAKAAQTAASDADAANAPAMAAIPAIAATPFVASSIIKSTIDLISLFRVDVSIKAKDLNITDLAFFSAVAGALQAKNVAVYDGAVIPPMFRDPDSAVQATLQELDGLIGRLNESDKKLDGALDKLKTALETITQEITDAKAAQPPKSTTERERQQQKITGTIDKANAEKGKIRATEDAYNTFRVALLKTDDALGLTPLAKILRAEKLDRCAQDAYWLMIKVAAAGGAYRTKRWLWKSEISYSGGVIAHFTLFDPQGKVVASGVHSGYNSSPMSEDGGLPKTWNSTEVPVS